MFRTSDDYLTNPVGIPRHFSTQVLAEAWQSGGLGRGLLNSLIAVVIGVVIATVTSSLAAWWFFRHAGRMSKLLLGLLLGVWLFPTVVYLLPLYAIAAQHGLTDNLVVLGVLYAAMNLPFGVWLLYTHFRDAVPEEVFEAAAMDGAGPLTTFRRIALPLSLPMLGTCVALFFIFMWGDLLLSVVMIQDPDKFTSTVRAASFLNRLSGGVQSSDAAAFVTMVPMLVVFLVAQRSIVRGFTAGIGK